MAGRLRQPDGPQSGALMSRLQGVPTSSPEAHVPSALLPRQQTHPSLVSPVLTRPPQPPGRLMGAGDTLPAGASPSPNISVTSDGSGSAAGLQRPRLGPKPSSALSSSSSNTTSALALSSDLYSKVGDDPLHHKSPDTAVQGSLNAARLDPQSSGSLSDPSEDTASDGADAVPADALPQAPPGVDLRNYARQQTILRQGFYSKKQSMMLNSVSEEMLNTTALSIASAEVLRTRCDSKLPTTAADMRQAVAIAQAVLGRISVARRQKGVDRIALQSAIQKAATAAAAKEHGEHSQWDHLKFSMCSDTGGAAAAAAAAVAAGGSCRGSSHSDSPTKREPRQIEAEEIGINSRLEETGLLQEVVLHSDRGARASMQDVPVYLPHFSAVFAPTVQCDAQDFFIAVYDGHGGPEAALYASQTLHYSLAQSPHFATDAPRAMREAFLNTDKEFAKCAAAHNCDAGTTALVCYLRGRQLTLGCLGDSRGILCRDGKAEQLSEVHSTQNPAERKRVYERGGVIFHNGGADRVNGMLQTTRSIGDRPCREVLSADPQILQRVIEPEHDEFILLATDGLFDVMDPDEVVTYVRTCRQEVDDAVEQCEEMAASLSRRQSAAGPTSGLVPGGPLFTAAGMDGSQARASDSHSTHSGLAHAAPTAAIVPPGSNRLPPVPGPLSPQSHFGVDFGAAALSQSHSAQLNPSSGLFASALGASQVSSAGSVTHERPNSGGLGASWLGGSASQGPGMGSSTGSSARHGVEGADQSGRSRQRRMTCPQGLTPRERSALAGSTSLNSPNLVGRFPVRNRSTSVCSGGVEGGSISVRMNPDSLVLRHLIRRHARGTQSDGSAASSSIHACSAGECSAPPAGMRGESSGDDSNPLGEGRRALTSPGPLPHASWSPPPIRSNNAPRVVETPDKHSHSSERRETGGSWTPHADEALCIAANYPEGSSPLTAAETCPQEKSEEGMKYGRMSPLRAAAGTPADGESTSRDAQPMVALFTESPGPDVLNGDECRTVATLPMGWQDPNGTIQSASRLFGPDSSQGPDGQTRAVTDLSLTKSSVSVSNPSAEEEARAPRAAKLGQGPLLRHLGMPQPDSSGGTSGLNSDLTEPVAGLPQAEGDPAGAAQGQLQGATPLSAEDGPPAALPPSFRASAPPRLSSVLCGVHGPADDPLEAPSAGSVDSGLPVRSASAPGMPEPVQSPLGTGTPAVLAALPPRSTTAVQSSGMTPARRGVATVAALSPLMQFRGGASSRRRTFCHRPDGQPPRVRDSPHLRFRVPPTGGRIAPGLFTPNVKPQTSPSLVVQLPRVPMSCRLPASKWPQPLGPRTPEGSSSAGSRVPCVGHVGPAEVTPLMMPAASPAVLVPSLDSGTPAGNRALASPCEDVSGLAATHSLHADLDPDGAVGGALLGNSEHTAHSIPRPGQLQSSQFGKSDNSAEVLSVAITDDDGEAFDDYSIVAEALLDVAKEKGSTDNLCVIIVFIRREGPALIAAAGPGSHGDDQSGHE